MSDWLHNPIFLMTLVVFGFTYLLTAGIHGLVTALAKGERARSRQSLPACCHHWALSSVCLSRSPLRRSGPITSGPIRRSTVKRARLELSWSSPLPFRVIQLLARARMRRLLGELAGGRKYRFLFRHDFQDLIFSVLH